MLLRQITLSVPCLWRTYLRRMGSCFSSPKEGPVVAGQQEAKKAVQEGPAEGKGPSATAQKPKGKQVSRIY